MDFNKRLQDVENREQDIQGQLAKIKGEADDARRKQALLGLIGSISQDVANVPTAYEIRKGRRVGGGMDLTSPLEALGKLQSKGKEEEQERLQGLLAGLQSRRQGLENLQLKDQLGREEEARKYAHLEKMKEKELGRTLIADQRKQQEKVGKVAVPGFSIEDKDFLPTPQDAKNLKAGVAQAGQLKDSINAFKRKVQEVGGAEMVGKDADDLNKMRKAIMLNAKELLNLGVLNGPDLDLLENLIPDPTSIGSNIRDVLEFIPGVSSPSEVINTQLDDFVEGNIDSKVRGLARAAGYAPQGKTVSQFNFEGNKVSLADGRTVNLSKEAQAAAKETSLEELMEAKRRRGNR